MRTTLTLDEDVAAKLKAEVRRTGEPFKQLVNKILRIGLTTPAKAKSKKPFKIKTRDLGRYPGLDYDNIHKLIEYGEGPFHR